jgi:hypothetical protein
MLYCLLCRAYQARSIMSRTIAARGAEFQVQRKLPHAAFLA